MDRKFWISPGPDSSPVVSSSLIMPRSLRHLRFGFAVCMALSADIAGRAGWGAEGFARATDANCSQYGTCYECRLDYGHNGNCGWCASNADGAGNCLPMDGGSHPRAPATCSDLNNTTMWNRACCSEFSDCSSCVNAYDKYTCKWCGDGSEVNEGKCPCYAC